MSHDYKWRAGWSIPREDWERIFGEKKMENKSKNTDKEVKEDLQQKGAKMGDWFEQNFRFIAFLSPIIFLLVCIMIITWGD